MTIAAIAAIGVRLCVLRGSVGRRRPTAPLPSSGT